MAERKRPTKKAESDKKAEKVVVELVEKKDIPKEAEIVEESNIDAEILVKTEGSEISLDEAVKEGLVEEVGIKTYSGASKIVEIAMQHCEFVWVNKAQPYIVHGKDYYPNGGWSPSEKEKEQFELMKNPFYEG